MPCFLPAVFFASIVVAVGTGLRWLKPVLFVIMPVITRFRRVKPFAATTVEQATFLRSFAAHFDELNQACLETRGVLVDYQNVPKEMPEEEADIVIDALRDCCRSVKFLYKIAQLVKARVIDTELLYILYYDEVWGYLTEKLKFLMRWVGTGLDLGANYNAHELARMVTSLTELLEELYAIHERGTAWICLPKGMRP